MRKGGSSGQTSHSGSKAHGEEQSSGDTGSERLRSVARAWAEIAQEELRLAKALQLRAAEQAQLAERFERQGDLAEASAARKREAQWLEEADDLLRKGEAALHAEGRIEDREDASEIPMMAVLKKHMPGLLLACWYLAYAVDKSPQIDPKVRDAILGQYEMLAPDLVAIRPRSPAVLMERLRAFLQAARPTLSPDVAAVWQRFEDTFEAVV